MCFSREVTPGHVVILGLAVKSRFRGMSTHRAMDIEARARLLLRQLVLLEVCLVSLHLRRVTIKYLNLHCLTTLGREPRLPLCCRILRALALLRIGSFKEERQSHSITSLV